MYQREAEVARIESGCPGDISNLIPHTMNLHEGHRSKDLPGRIEKN
jgi:hypothetical protein